MRTKPKTDEGVKLGGKKLLAELQSASVRQTAVIL
jgi:hypothetical protein